MAKNIPSPKPAPKQSFTSSNVIGLFKDSDKADFVDNLRITVANMLVANEKELGELTDEAISEEFTTMIQQVTNIFVEAKTAQAVDSIYKDLASSGQTDMGGFNTLYGNDLLRKSEAYNQGRKEYHEKIARGEKAKSPPANIGTGATYFGAFLEKGIFGISGGNASEIGDVILPGGKEVELKGAVLSHNIRVGGFTVSGSTATMMDKIGITWGKDLAVANLAREATNLIALYKIFMKMKNLFMLKFNFDFDKFSNVRVEFARLYYNLIFAKVYAAIADSSVITVEWQPAKTDSTGRITRAGEVHLNAQTFNKVNKLTDLYLRNHSFFESAGDINDPNPAEFFGTIRGMEFIPLSDPL